MDPKPLNAYTFDDLKATDEASFHALSAAALDTIAKLEVSRQNVWKDGHDVRMKLKKRTVDYLTFQKQAVDLNTQYLQIKEQLGGLRMAFLRFQRDWCRANGRNQVPDPPQLAVKLPEGAVL